MISSQEPYVSYNCRHFSQSSLHSQVAGGPTFLGVTIQCTPTGQEIVIRNRSPSEGKQRCTSVSAYGFAGIWQMCWWEAHRGQKGQVGGIEIMILMVVMVDFKD